MPFFADFAHENISFWIFLSTSAGCLKVLYFEVSIHVYQHKHLHKHLTLVLLMLINS